MTRLIDADALKKYIEDCMYCEKCKKKRNCLYECVLPNFLTEDWERIINEQKTIDAIPVIRCKDCAWFESSTNTCRHFLSSRAPEEFCNRAKEREVE